MDEIFNINSPKKKEISASLDATNEIRLDEDDENDPFGGGGLKKDTSSSNLDQPFNTGSSSVTPSINIKANISPASSPPAQAPTPSVNQLSSNLASTSLASVSSSSQSTKKQAVEQDYDDDEERDKFIEISVSDPTKVGEGMSSYMTYKVTTKVSLFHHLPPSTSLVIINFNFLSFFFFYLGFLKTNYSCFKKDNFSTNRRFSDFLNLAEKLKEKHLPAGRILPPPPEKDMLGTTKVKMTAKDESSPSDFIERRKAHLERFLNRVAQHPSLRLDPDFRDFLEIADLLPKATNTSALSGASVMKLFKSVGEAVQKINVKMPQSDQVSLETNK